jgi:hypothetical protein
MNLSEEGVRIHIAFGFLDIAAAGLGDTAAFRSCRAATVLKAIRGNVNYR